MLHDHEDQRQHDRELEEPLLDAAPAAVDRRVATEGGAQAGAARLQQDRGHQADADQDLGEADDGFTGDEVSGGRQRAAARIASAAQRARGQRPATLSDRSASGPSCRRRPAHRPAPAASARRRRARRRADAARERPSRPARTGTGLSEWAVIGLPVGVAHLVGIAVVGGDRQQRAGPPAAHSQRPCRRPPRSRGRGSSRRSPPPPSRPRRRCGRPCRGWRSWPR